MHGEVLKGCAKANQCALASPVMGCARDETAFMAFGSGLHLMACDFRIGKRGRQEKRNITIGKIGKIKL